jgi:hypothetical protein
VSAWVFAYNAYVCVCVWVGLHAYECMCGGRGDVSGMIENE